MNIEYKKYINEYDPVSVGWVHEEKDVLLNFSEPITAVYSEPLDRVIVELFSENRLCFYNLAGALESSGSLPRLEHYQYRGIHKSIGSKSKVSFLFHPIDDSVGNKWRDTEQYELDIRCNNFLGKNLGIYR